MEVAQDPEPTKTTEPLTKETVKERIERINRSTQNSPGKFPEMKQVMIKVYFTRKSPKVKQVREKRDIESETNLKLEENLRKLQGALKKAPFREILIILGHTNKHQWTQAQFLWKEGGLGRRSKEEDPQGPGKMAAGLEGQPWRSWEE